MGLLRGCQPLVVPLVLWVDGQYLSNPLPLAYKGSEQRNSLWSRAIHFEQALRSCSWEEKPQRYQGQLRKIRSM